MNAASTVTAIIVVGNGKRFLGDALQSITGQSRQPDEVIVVGGQSTERTAAIAQATPGVRYLLQADLRIANAWSLAMRAAVFDRVGWFDPAFAAAFEMDWLARAQDLDAPSAAVETVLLHKLTPSTSLSNASSFARNGS